MLPNDGVVDVPTIGLDHVGEKYTFQLVDEQTSTDCPQQLQNGIFRVMGAGRSQMLEQLLDVLELGLAVDVGEVRVL